MKLVLCDRYKLVDVGGILGKALVVVWYCWSCEMREKVHWVSRHLYTCRHGHCTLTRGSKHSPTVILKWMNNQTPLREGSDAEFMMGPFMSPSGSGYLPNAHVYQKTHRLH